MSDLEIFEGKKFSDLMKDIYENSSEKRGQLDVLLNELRPLVTSIEQATMLYPIIKDVMDLGIKNDEMLIKLANVFQKHISVDKKSASASIEGILSDEDKENILKDLDLELLNKDEQKIKKIKDEVANILGENDHV